MKTMLPLAICILAAVTPVVTRAGDPVADVTILAAQKDTDERLKRVEAMLQNIQETQELVQRHQESLRQRMEKLEDQFRTSKESHDQASAGFQRQLDYYEKKLKEMEQKRQADTKLILTNIAQLANLPVASQQSEIKTPSSSPHGAQEQPAAYVVKKNDRLSEIIASHNQNLQQGQAKITQEQVLRANPGLKPDLLIPGQKIRMPVANGANEP